MDKIIIEARINEYMPKDCNPHVPYTADEIADDAARCQEAGASILHFHARLPGGQPEHSGEAYAEIIRKVRQKCDLLILPTLGFIHTADDPRHRIDFILDLAKDTATKPDFAPVGPGTLNLEHYDAVNQVFSDTDAVYEHSTAIVQHYIDRLNEVDVRFKPVCWNVNFLRRVLCMEAAGLFRGTTYFEILLTEGPFISGNPATIQSIDSFLALLPAGWKGEWTSMVMEGNLISLAPHIVRRGGHLAIGIGDYPYHEYGTPSNQELITMAAEIARAHGRAPTTPAETRQILQL